LVNPPSSSLFSATPKTACHKPAAVTASREFFLLQSIPWSTALERASAGLDRVIGQALRRVPPRESALLAWPVACGSAVADRTLARSFSNGVLYIEVADQGWRRELSALAGQYLSAINRFSAERVERIEFVVAK
jgi:hypothetical protein